MANIFERHTGRVWKLGDSVDTNQLAPTQSGDGSIQDWLRASCLRTTRPEFTSEVKQGDIVVAGANFGCGSSRQTAVQSLQLSGVVAVLAESVARLYRRNSIALAFPTFVVPGISQLVDDGDALEIDYAAHKVRHLRTGAELPIPPLPSSVEQIYESGGIAPMIGRRLAAMGITPGPEDKAAPRGPIPIIAKS